MSEESNIGWTHSTYNPWRGCRKVSLECANCYIVDTPPLRSIGQKHGDVRKRGSENVLKSAYDWNEKQRRDLEDWTACVVPGSSQPESPQWRVFCMSLGDWLDDENVPIEWLWRLLKTVKECEHLTWLMLTKRSQNFKPRLHAAMKWDEDNNKENDGLHNWILDWHQGDAVPQNVWFGGSMMNGKVPQALLDVPARVRWLSAEPLLPFDSLSIDLKGLHWLVAGGESGRDGVRRDCGAISIGQLAQQCVREQIPVFVKQDCARKPGQQGRIPDDIWALKQFPK